MLVMVGNRGIVYKTVDLAIAGGFSVTELLHVWKCAVARGRTCFIHGFCFSLAE